MARYWGFWTLGKLDLLRRYIKAFNQASSGKSTERIYLDLFGGEAENKSKYTEETFDGSARLALNCEPSFTRLRFFEKEPNATKLRTVLEKDYSGRDFKVIPGDCNDNLAGVLSELSHLRWAPTFAFVDPNGADFRWSTLEQLATFRNRQWKTEIWLLLAAGMFIRNLRKDGSVNPKESEKLSDLYGTEQWRAIYEARVAGRLDGGAARDEYVNLMRYRLENVLGYKWTHPLEVFNEGNHSIYHMIFATDHDRGDAIMRHLYTSALNDLPKMREAVIRQRVELAPQPEDFQGELFAPESYRIEPLPVPKKTYAHSPPWAPFDSVDDPS